MALISYITQIHLHDGAIAVLRDERTRVGIRRPLFVTDPGIVRAGLLDRVLAAAGLADAAVFADTPGNPNEHAVRQAAAIYRERECDGVIAVGGGSSIDLAKGVAVCATHDGPLRTFAAIEGGVERITAATAPVIAVPTTAGTGSEVGRGAVLILDDGRKVGILSPHLVPKSAICDPDLTLGLPARLTAATGMDAIAHCIETFLAPAFNPPADGIALDGLWRGWRHIEAAVRNPGDRVARLNMMSTSMQGALAFQKGLGCVHSLSHSLGGLRPDLHHGTLNAIFLPAVVRFNREAPSVVERDAMQRLATAMGLADAAGIEDALDGMTRRLDLPTGLSDLGVQRTDFDRIVDGAMKDHCHKTNPREATREDYLALLAQSF